MTKLPPPTVPRHARREPAARDTDDAIDREALLDDMFPASLLPSFAPIHPRRHRSPESSGRPRRERHAHGR